MIVNCMFRFRGPATGDRCRAAGIPDEVGFAGKPRLMIMMLERALAAGLPFAWFTADEAYGRAGYLRDRLEACDVFYVVATRCDQQVCTRADRIERADGLIAELLPASWQRCSSIPTASLTNRVDQQLRCHGRPVGADHAGHYACARSGGGRQCHVESGGQ